MLVEDTDFIVDTMKSPGLVAPPYNRHVEGLHAVAVFVRSSSATPLAKPLV